MNYIAKISCAMCFVLLLAGLAIPGEEYFGEELKGLRDKVFIITKHFGIRNFSTPVNKKQLIEKCNKSLKKLQREDFAMLRSYQEQVHSKYCRVSCNQCESSCPGGVAISDIMRYEMYYDNYGHEKEGMRNYALLESTRKPLHCANCGGFCTASCPFGIEVQKRLVRANEILS
ncbi:MAG: hypothetical protein A2Y62_08910 [Candidatus Fischerbacteria bacterium RBG_13_37_8]|uniref:4Fe-4S ferredoxin-type domain-containing protein n=1 Tax=Candidatus Fischerbacteria bacterium RBG_13_37_8 TaxID=1817863 RepID=A0A1F5VUL6_9BACT|nr:MAG: hypothetical protein A2Y62_08910 [Candidatus Fischerbacteria bacterium RBG_13_37_8]